MDKMQLLLSLLLMLKFQLP